MADKDTKKQIPLRVSAKLYDALAAWAEDDFRSLNGQIEYLLTECVRHRRGQKIEEENGEDAGVRGPFETKGGDRGAISGGKL